MLPVTLADALVMARRAGLDRFDAELLLSDCCDLPRSRLIAHPESPLAPDLAERYLNWVARRARGEPVAHLTCRKGFMDIELEVSPAVLIPRPDTELLVLTALDRLPPTQAHVIDLGTGSGAIALALAVARPHWKILATDSSSSALAVARRNVDRIAPGRVQLIASDWFAALGPHRFDGIIANPPYVADGDPELAADVAAYEPASALFAPDDGLAALAVLTRAAMERLHPGGWIMLEHGHRQGSAVRDLMTASGLTAVETLPDTAQRERVTIGRQTVP